MDRKEHARETTNCKVLPPEAVTSHHRVLVAEMHVNKSKRGKINRKEIDNMYGGFILNTSCGVYWRKTMTE